jgi:hypothetical protein
MSPPSTSSEPSSASDERARSEGSSIPASDDRSDRYCIVGAGPSGLAMAAAFRRHGIAYDQFERHHGVGGLWDQNNAGSPLYDSAHFISSRTCSAFAGFPMPEDYPDYPKHSQILDYLKSYARHHQLEDGITFNTSVDEVVPEAGSANVRIDGELRRYRGVVCASGVNWDPIVPSFEGTFSGELRHASTYKSAHELEGKRVLIVGLGNSGADIACDAARAAASTTVSVRRGYYFVPKHIFGKPADVFASEGPQLPLWLEQPIFGWLQRLLVGDTTKLGMPKPDHKLLQSHPLMNDQLLHHLRHGDAQIKGDILRFEGKEVVFRDQSRLPVDLVLLATGYSRRIAYLDPQFLDGARWAAGNFLTCFSRKLDSLFTLGFAELNGALYPHLCRLADLIAHVADAQLKQPELAERFYTWANDTTFDLTGGRALIDTPRHAHYCDDHALEHATLKAFKKMGWKPPTS